jgi:N-acetylglucosaminyldiphosphoundecaprenol N-acetyl-beta-D-mannosaminyltransferase
MMAPYLVLGTPLQPCSYESLTKELKVRAADPRPFAVDFTNTHIVTLRRHEPSFRSLTEAFDYFIPDGMPLIWCLNWLGAALRDRVYGPTFMRRCVLAAPAPLTHYFLGGNDECVRRLKEYFLRENPNIKIIGTRSGYFSSSEEQQIIDEINALSPDFIWVGLGTPKQQAWIQKYKRQLRRGVVLAVGFAFDVNAGMKPDAPLWMQRLGMTWVYRMLSEPGRLAGRYIRYNSLFLFYLVWDALRGQACRRPKPA